ncbi:MAG: 6-carboxytetrahydropterin synthase [bacterium]
MMYLTLSKRFEFSSSYRYYNPKWSDKKNTEHFGMRCGGFHGYGSNFVTYFIFHGDVDPKTGMIINVTIIKEKINNILNSRYDHKFLNLDTKPFDEIVPTPENMAKQLLAEAVPLFKNEQAMPVACHVVESENNEATAYADGRVERHLWTSFSAARSTRSPHLSDEENEKLFGTASSKSGHGHGYRLRVTLGGEIDPDSGLIVPDNLSHPVIKSIYDLMDHKNLNLDVLELKNIPITTECLSRFIFNKLSDSLPVNRLCLWENPWFFAEYAKNDHCAIGVVDHFQSAHRLHSRQLSDKENIAIYGKCNNPNGHGHRYKIEPTIKGKIDEKSGTLFSLDKFVFGIKTALKQWDFKHLDLDTDDFKNEVSTGENIIKILFPKIEKYIEHEIDRLRLWETFNNRFTLRRL